MAVALPLLAIAGGAAAAATAVTAFGVIAGVASVVSGVAAMAGKTKIAKIAGIIALGAGAFSMVAGAAAGATPAVEALGGPAAGEGAIATELAGQTGNTAIADVAKTTDLSTNIAEQAPGVVDATPNAISGSNVVDTGTQSALASPFGGGQSLAQPTSPFASPAGSELAAGTEAVPKSLSSIERAGSPVQTSFLDSLKKVGQVLKENKELVDIGGGMLKGAFGNEAQMIDLNKKRLSLLQQQQAFDEAQRQRENANANNIVGLRTPLIFNPNAPAVRRTT